ncbi:MAG: signal recognition particle receptor subunit alpha, partial [Campylobacter sp.]|nr:signal recognition particle receptor subunit alpha [Campylobacter sp.]
MFEVISESFKSAVNKLRIIDDEKALKNALDTLKKALLKADVHHKVTKEFLNLVDGVRSTIRQTFVWSLGVTVLFFLVYGVGGVPLLRLMT